ncbi:ETS-related transcription factor Elf-5 [Bombina bombina]|uniref:ETS-related transcription factor Elf-5 n=1 Tax=Bombina bombina TaxID=8345 RepID=UPI00235AAC59|nr:ETS-related transcription factor Elf-5 [Bombina bombina]
MKESFTYGTLIPVFPEAHFSWTEFLCSDIDPTSNDLSPGVPPLWTSVPPEHWTRNHVCDWLQYCCDSYKLDATCIPFSCFDVSGLQLCTMTKEDFTNAAGVCGQHLYSLLQDIRTHGVSILGTTEEKESISTYNDEKQVVKTPSVRRHKSPPRSRSGAQSSHLWEFLRDLLLSPEDNEGILDWEDHDKGIFRVVNSEALARIWGQRKRNDRMNYEKLSRALRHYYKTGILERVDRRLMYKFGKNAYGWR